MLRPLHVFDSDLFLAEIDLDGLFARFVRNYDLLWHIASFLFLLLPQSFWRITLLLLCIKVSKIILIFVRKKCIIYVKKEFLKNGGFYV